MTNHAVQSLWIGERLSTMERLAITSFLRCGHEYHLYTYGDVAGLPHGVTLRDGNEILPSEHIFAYHSGFGEGSVSAFSNFFRYKLLAERGGWWVDADVVCLRRFDFSNDVVLGAEVIGPDAEGLIVSSAVIRQPVGGALASWAWEECQHVDPQHLQWGQVGPRLLQRGVETLGLQLHVRPHTAFSPVPWFSCRDFVDPDIRIPLTADAYAVHLWHQMWVHHGIDPDEAQPAACLYEQLKGRFLV